MGQWRRFADAANYQTDAEKRGEAWCFSRETLEWQWIQGKSWRDPNYGFAVQDDHPAACLSWNDATAFCAWLTEREKASGWLPAGYVYRLPAEHEWEFACRGGLEGERFWWGTELSEGKGCLNIASDDSLGVSQGEMRWYPRAPWSDGYAWAAPVDSYAAEGRNQYGLADMLGNLQEWCLDSYDAAGPRGRVYTGSPGRRVVRGGGFTDPPAFCRCAPPMAVMWRPSRIWPALRRPVPSSRRSWPSSCSR